MPPKSSKDAMSTSQNRAYLELLTASMATISPSSLLLALVHEHETMLLRSSLLHGVYELQQNAALPPVISSPQADPLRHSERDHKCRSPNREGSHIRNDSSYYPNIQCALCAEWVCSRNRYMHIESHFNYRPYKCSVCSYENRKEIFIEIHARKVHGGHATTVYRPNDRLEKRAWDIAELSMARTKAFLSASIEGPLKPEKNIYSTCQREEIPKYRARIHNAQRAKRNRLIETSRKNGTMPKLHSSAIGKRRASVSSSSMPVRESDVGRVSQRKSDTTQLPFLRAALAEGRKLREKLEGLSDSSANDSVLEKLLGSETNTCPRSTQGNCSSPLPLLSALLFDINVSNS